MNNVIRIATCCSANRTWTAVLFVGDVETTSAGGRDEGAAVADVVAKFRTSRLARRA